MASSNESFTRQVLDGQIKLWYGQFSDGKWHVYVLIDGTYCWLKDERQYNLSSYDIHALLHDEITKFGGLLDINAFYPVDGVTVTREGHDAKAAAASLPGLASTNDGFAARIKARQDAKSRANDDAAPATGKTMADLFS